MSDLTFERGDYVRKKSGAFWEGDVVGDYSTDQTEHGVNVRLFGWKDGPVQIYPASALEHVSPVNGRLAEARDKTLEEAANEIKRMSAAMGRIADHSEASQKKAQAAIDMLEVAETVVRALKEKP